MAEIEEGDIVESRHGIKGQVIEVYENYWAISTKKGKFLSMPQQSWLDAQLIPFTYEQINNEKWFSVHCFDGGAIWSCESKLTLIDKIKLP